MSRTHRFLVVALAAMGLLLGAARLIDDSPDGSTGAEVSEGAGSSGSTVAVSPTAASTTVAGPRVCEISTVLETGAFGAEVECLEQWLAAKGYLVVAPDAVFDADTDVAVRSFQAASAVSVDGVVGKVTASLLGTWTGPDGPMPLSDIDCPSTPHAALVDRANQRGALCENGVITYTFPITSARSQPDPGTYSIYAKDLNASSSLSGEYSTMTHFVAFTRGKFQGARIAFHSVPTYSNGEFIQPLDSVGTEQYFGASAGCIRVLPDDAVKIWDWLSIDDAVRVIS